ncbi:MAG: NAD(P)/FAD-dependent oxidoreductase [Kangiellaceae bacterium]
MEVTKHSTNIEQVDVLIIGAGPSGSVCGALLNQAGVDVLIIEKQVFPRFSIGESLLPQSMVYLEKAGMLDSIEKAGYQFKNGAAFRDKQDYSTFDFRQKFSTGPGTTFQVKRAEFDKRLADCAESQGVKVRYQQEVVNIDNSGERVLLEVESVHGERYQISANFVLDASGFGRVLPRLLELEKPSSFPMRQSVFCHIEDNISDPSYDREKILVTVHPKNKDVWFWLIPFSDGNCSLGVVAEPKFFEQFDGTAEQILNSCLEQDEGLSKLLENARIINQVNQINGYAADVSSLVGKNFALLGNAGEFLDPVFSSGVTIAVKSADLAASLLMKERAGESVCWQTDYAKPLKSGVDTFRVLVEAWYDGRLQDIIFYQQASDDVRAMVCSILAGYAWDDENPYVSKTQRRMDVLAQICKR